MEVLHHIPAILLAVCVTTVGAFAVAVNYKISSARDLYEKQIKEPLDDAEFIVNWIEISGFLLPMIACTFVRDWRRIFSECFGPFTLWLDAFHSIILIIQFIAFVGDIEENTGRIQIEYCGLALPLFWFFIHVMLKQLEEPGLNRDRAITQAICVVVAVLSSGIVMQYQLQFKHEVPDGYEQVAWNVAFIGMVNQAAQAFEPVISVAFRIRKENFQNDEPAIRNVNIVDEPAIRNVNIVDEPAIRNVNIVATLLRLITLVYDVWFHTSKGYWDSPYKKPLVVLECVSLCVCVWLVVLQDVGSENIKAGIDGSKAYLKREWSSMKAKITSI